MKYNQHQYLLRQKAERKTKETMREKTKSSQFVLLNVIVALIFIGFYAINLTIGLIAENRAVQLVGSSH